MKALIIIAFTLAATLAQAQTWSAFMSAILMTTIRCTKS